MGKCSNHIVFSCKTFIRVYINHTLIKNLKKDVKILLMAGHNTMTLT